MIGKRIVEGGASGLVIFATEAFDQMLPFLAAMVVVVMADLRFGRKAAKWRGEVVRWSGSIRRTINKFIEYLCWISVAVVLDMAFCEFQLPIRYVILGLVFLIELQSCFNNYLEPKGKRLSVDYKEIFGGKLKWIKVEEKKDV